MPNNEISWSFIADQINRRRCTPVISNQLILGTLFPNAAVAAEWARTGNYPLADTNLAMVAQYLSVTYRDAYRFKNRVSALSSAFLSLQSKRVSSTAGCSIRCAANAH